MCGCRQGEVGGYVYVGVGRGVGGYVCVVVGGGSRWVCVCGCVCMYVCMCVYVHVCVVISVCFEFCLLFPPLRQAGSLVLRT